MPGYTHIQIRHAFVVRPVVRAYAETLVDDMRLIAAAWHIANQNPLGSAAGYGSSFPLDRTMTTRLMGFETLHYNVVAAQMSRGKSERAAASAIAAIAATVGRLAMDVCLFMSQNFGFVSLPDNLTTGSSIMPHKKNPDVFEIMRGRCNRLQSVPNEIALLTANLPIGYHRDMQLLKDILFPATTEIKRTLSMCDFMLAHLKVNAGILDDPKYDYLFTVEDVNPARARRRSLPRSLQTSRHGCTARPVPPDARGAPHPRRQHRQSLHLRNPPENGARDGRIRITGTAATKKGCPEKASFFIPRTAYLSSLYISGRSSSKRICSFREKSIKSFSE